MSRAFTRALTLLLLLFTLCAVLVAQAQDAVSRAMKDELARSMEGLRLPDLDKPYFVSYRVDDVHSSIITASLGTLTSSNNSRSRLLSIDMRVGDYALDNSNFLSMADFRRNMFSDREELPLDDDYEQIRRDIWLATDRAYKSAAETLASKRSVLQHRQSSVNLPDFIKEGPVTVEAPPAQMKLDVPSMEKLARDVSAVFREYADIYVSSVEVDARDKYTRYLNSEGSWYTRSEPLVLVRVTAQIRDVDGLPINDAFLFAARSSDNLPSDQLLGRARELANGLRAMRNAPVLESYNGPVLFQGSAGAESLAQVLAPALATSRFPITDQPQAEAQIQQSMNQLGGVSLADRIGSRLLPAGFDVTDEPGPVPSLKLPLFGNCPIDNEAVRGRELKLIDNGILKSVLSTRTPTQQTKESTGSAHAMGASPCNLILSVSQGKSDGDLKAKLLSEVKERDLPYGIIVRRVGMGGLTWMMRVAMAQLTGGAPSTLGEVYRVYPDGREERLRELEVGPLTAASFKDISAAGETPAMDNAGYIPMAGSLIAIMAGRGFDLEIPEVVTYVSPSLLFDDVSLKRSSGPAPNAPIAPSPLASSNAAK